MRVEDLDWDDEALCEHEIAAVDAWGQHAHVPEQAEVDRPVLPPKKPAGQSTGAAELAGQYDPNGLERNGTKERDAVTRRESRSTSNAAGLTK